MMESDEQEKPKYWFKAKRYGWGWQPSSWQGWLVTLLYLVAIFLLLMGQGIDAGTDLESFREMAIALVLLTILFIVIAWRTGEPPRWRWGRRRDEDNNQDVE